MRTRAVLFFIMMVCASCNIARADLIYDIFFRGAFGDAIDSTTNATPEQKFTGVQVIFRETVSGGSTSLLAAANLNAYAVNVFNTGSNGTFNTLTLNTSGGFAGAANDANTLNFVALGISFGQPGRTSTDIGGGRREALLGTLDLVAPTAGSTTFRLADFSSSDGDFTTFLTGASGLESLAVASGGSLNGRSLTITAVPEPSSLLLLGIPIAIGLMRRKRS